MTATDILTLYRHSSRVFWGKASAWILLIEICDAGHRGMTHADIMHAGGSKSEGSRASTLRRWVRTGLLEARTILAKSRKEGAYKGGKPRIIYTATKKAHDLLRIQPVEKA